MALAVGALRVLVVIALWALAVCALRALVLWNCGFGDSRTRVGRVAGSGAKAPAAPKNARKCSRPVRVVAALGQGRGAARHRTPEF